MHKSIFAMTAILFLVAASPAALARGLGGVGGGPGGFGGGPPAFAGSGPQWQGSYPPGFSEGEKTGWQGGSVPPGWSKGKKKGWNGHNVPPGFDLPPLKWSSLMYVFDRGGYGDGKEKAYG